MSFMAKKTTYYRAEIETLTKGDYSMKIKVYATKYADVVLVTMISLATALQTGIT